MPTSTTGSSSNHSPARRDNKENASRKRQAGTGPGFYVKNILRRPYPSVGTRGFTLMELIVVMVLLSLLTAFAVPRIRTSLFSDQLKAGARGLIGLISETGQEARRAHRAWQLLYDPVAHRFSAEPIPSGTSPATESQTIRPVTLPEGVRVVDITTARNGISNEGQLRLRFSARGYVDQTLIHLADDGGRNLTLALSPFLGSIRIYDSYLDMDQERAQWQ